LNINNVLFFLLQLIDATIPHQFENMIVETLITSQSFMRAQKVSDRVVIITIIATFFNFDKYFQNEVSFVSLRDVERAVKVFLWFLKQEVLKREIERTLRQREEKARADRQHMGFEESDGEDSEDGMPDIATDDGSLDWWTRSFILSLGVCYHACLEMGTRERYRHQVARIFTRFNRLPHHQPERILEDEISL
jgi:hypothetical protein